VIRRPTAGTAPGATHTLTVKALRWLSEKTFEIRFERPDRFAYLPGQKIGFVDGSRRRDYTLLGPAEADELALCVRLVVGGRFSPKLARADRGERFQVTAPFGYFTFKASARPAVFVAAGTGIAPFVAYARAGVRGFDLLHGVRSPMELYYRETLSAAARRYAGSVRRTGRSVPGGRFPGGDLRFLPLRPLGNDTGRHPGDRSEISRIASVHGVVRLSASGDTRRVKRCRGSAGEAV
jgi:hypothetical protein